MARQWQNSRMNLHSIQKEETVLSWLQEMNPKYEFRYTPDGERIQERRTDRNEGWAYGTSLSTWNFLWNADKERRGLK